MLLAASLALAGPTRCTAAWTGPADGCGLLGAYAAQATATSEKAARRGVATQLEEVLALAVKARLSRVQGLEEGTFHACPAVVEQAYVDCFPEPALAEERLCFVMLEDPECWTRDVLHFEALGWKALAIGRARMCEAVDTRIVQQAWKDTELRRAVCRAKCEAATTVRCP